MQNQNDKTMAVLAYILFLIPLLAVSNRSEFLNHHVNQGLILFIFAIIGNIISYIIPIPFLGLIFCIADIFFVIYGIMQAVNGTTNRLPVIGGFELVK
jgi:uncharacterized membrane protein